MAISKLILVALVSLFIGFIAGAKLVSRMHDSDPSRVSVLSYVQARNPMEELAEIHLISKNLNDDANRFLVASVARKIETLSELAKGPGIGSTAAEDILRLVVQFAREHQELSKIDGFDEAINKISPRIRERT